MFPGLFPQEELLTRRQALSLIPQCGSCKLNLSCKSPVMPVDGKGRSKILILGESPGKEEDFQGRPFVGPSGSYLQEALGKLGIDLREDCWITNSLLCRPPKNKIPNPRCVDYCRPNLIQTIQDLKPELVIPLGKVAVSSLIGWVWKEDPGPISRWAGWQIPSQKLNAWIAPNYHPAHVLRADEKKGERRLLDKFFYKYLEQAIKLPARPWKEVPNYDKAVRRVYEVDRGAEYISRFVGGTPVAFDFETDRLKPDSADSQIVCCSMSNGRDTVAFPWQGPVVPAFKEFLTSNTPKVGANIRFEHRWCKRLLGVDVKNWVWDTVTNAHILDNRKGISSVKFQAFVLLGAESYDTQMKAYMNSQGSNSPNRLRSAPLDKLLLYCGKDSLLEWEIAQVQSNILGMKL